MTTNTTLSEQVKAIHLLLVDESMDYRSFTGAVFNEQAIEGSLLIDSIRAADMIRDTAKRLGDEYGEVAQAKLQPIVEALDRVLKRNTKLNAMLNAVLTEDDLP